MRFKCENVIPKKAKEVAGATILFGSLTGLLTLAGSSFIINAGITNPILFVLAAFGAGLASVAVFLGMFAAIGGIVFLFTKLNKFLRPEHEWKTVYAWIPRRVQSVKKDEQTGHWYDEVCVWRENYEMRRWHSGGNVRVQRRIENYEAEVKKLEDAYWTKQGYEVQAN